MTDLKKFLKTIFHGLPGERDPNLFDDGTWVLFAGDKGGGSMKFHLEIINSITSGKVDKIHIFCMYAGADTVENAWKCFMCFNSQSLTSRKETKDLQQAIQVALLAYSRALEKSYRNAT